MPSKFTAVVIDTDDGSRSSLITQLRTMPGVSVEKDAGDLQLGMKLARQVRPSLLVIEAKPLDEALAAAERFHLDFPATSIFILSSDTQPNTILRAMRAGAQGVHAPPGAAGRFRRGGRSPAQAGRSHVGWSRQDLRRVQQQGWRGHDVGVGEPVGRAGAGDRQGRGAGRPRPAGGRRQHLHERARAEDDRRRVRRFRPDRLGPDHRRAGAAPVRRLRPGRAGEARADRGGEAGQGQRDPQPRCGTRSRSWSSTTGTVSSRRQPGGVRPRGPDPRGRAPQPAVDSRRAALPRRVPPAQLPARPGEGSPGGQSVPAADGHRRRAARGRAALPGVLADPERLRAR